MIVFLKKFMWILVIDGLINSNKIPIDIVDEN